MEHMGIIGTNGHLNLRGISGCCFLNIITYISRNINDISAAIFTNSNILAGNIAAHKAATLPTKSTLVMGILNLECTLVRLSGSKLSLDIAKRSLGTINMLTNVTVVSPTIIPIVTMFLAHVTPISFNTK